MASPNPGGSVYKRGECEEGDIFTIWNAVIDKVNDERQNQPSLPEDTECDPLDPIDCAEENHVWTKDDVQAVHDAIDEMCPYDWDDIPDYWKKEIIDEIEEALNRDYGGWGDEDDECCFKKCQAEDERVSLFLNEQSCSAVLLQWECGQWPGPCYNYKGDPNGNFDWYSAALGIPGYDSGVGGSISIKFSYMKDGAITSTHWLQTLMFRCDGEGFKSHTPPTYPLSYSEYGQLDACFYCGDYQPAGFWIWMYCGYCIIGYDPRHCGQCCEEAPVYLIDPTCDCPFNEGWVASNCTTYQAYLDDCAAHSYAQWWYADKIASEEFHGEGAPCRKCCSDGEGFCPYDCPGDPACGDGGEEGEG